MCQRYDTASQNVLGYLVKQGFSKTARNEFRRISRQFARHLEEQHLRYSQEIAVEWVRAYKPFLARTRFLSLRRALALVEDADRNGLVTTQRFSYDDTPLKYRTPDGYQQLLGDYIERRGQDGNQASTLQMDSIACTRFLLFLQSNNISSVASITPEIVKLYQAQAKHRTAAGRNAYVRRIRGFVRFLASKKLVPGSLEFAFATEKAPSVSVVTTLSKEQVNSITTFGEKSRSPSELRSAAMVMLALRMGLRSVDICNLRLVDISWKSKTLSIVQQKTGVPLTLPFPVAVGNLLARYILQGRPRCEEANIFVTLKHPFTKVTSSSCYVSSVAVLGRKESESAVRGLHVARRTFASNLLTAGNPVPTIAFALGHSDDSSVDEYLATDELRMRQCAIGLSGIEVREALK